MNNVINFLKNSGIALIILVVQIFLMGYDFWWTSFLLPVSVMILTTFFDLDTPYFIIFIVGLGLSWFSILPFGTYVIVFGILYLFLKYLALKIFPQGSSYAMVLCALVGLIFYQIEIWFFNKMAYWLGIISLNPVVDKFYFQAVAMEIVMSCGLIIILSMIFGLHKKYYYV
ncbi:MAG: hypothetical protein WCX88_02405 [Patescibacteria group bacterium]